MISVVDTLGTAASRFELLWIIAGLVFEKGETIGFIGEGAKGEQQPNCERS